ncbi:hypothetical protein CTAYLR_009335 [Chrysophaeum taylorii]|uniref:t-SNARE coiled-coil homology domain-containing protein n=1 Tax=Chrysophaeum taylorii TaxID=2483200 RepID=A0AAD7UMZ0_9STRA|nr:hypothetical protein CTAYLR_009335 [Chrysophaeum taylorii]
MEWTAAAGGAEVDSRDLEAPLMGQEVLEIEERERDIEVLASRVSTVNAVFADIADLVSAQQEDVDSIETAVRAANDRTNRGSDQLSRAERGKKTKLKCCFWVAVFLFFFMLILCLAIIGFKNIAKYAA